MREPSLRRRIVLALSASVALMTLAAAIASALLLRAHVERGFDARLREIGQTMLTSLSRGSDGVVEIAWSPEGPDFTERFSGWYWLIRQDGAAIARSRSLLTQDLPQAQPGETVLASGPRGEALRLRGSATRTTSDPAFAIVVAGPQAEVDALLARELTSIVVGVLALGCVLIGLVWWQLARHLRPLTNLASEVRRLHDGEIAALPPAGYAELDRLGSTINALLDETRGLVSGYRERAAKLAHALKTPLALIAARAGATGAKPDPLMLEAVQAMQRQIDQNLKRARAAGRSAAFAARTPLAPIVEDLMFAFGHAFQDRALNQKVAIPEGASFPGEREDLEEMLGNLLENAHRYAASAVRFEAKMETGALVLSIEDDGPGFSADAGVDAQGNGLGLPITREIAALYGGVMEMSRMAAGGARVTLRFPARRPS
jgi:signal transduction histidine kinase